MNACLKKKRVRSTIRAQTLIPRTPLRRLRPTDYLKDLLHGGDCFSPLEQGGDDLLSPNVRVSYNELGRLIIKCKRWPKAYVMKRLRVNLYCQTMVINENGESRTYWSTDTQYPYFGGARRDTVEITLQRGTHMIQYIDTYMKPYVITHMNKHVQVDLALTSWWPSFEWHACHLVQGHCHMQM